MSSATTIHRREHRGANGATADANMRQLTRRRPLPNGRAAVGGLLVAVSAIALFAIGQRGTDSLERYVVASRDLAIGTRIAGNDLTTSPLRIPRGALRGRLFDRSERLVGAVVIAPITSGELVQASAVLESSALADQRQISVPIESARALGERLRIGELVDVVATFGAGAEAYTLTVVTGARVVGRDGAAGPLSDRNREVVVLAVGTAADGVAIAHAVAAGQISLVRVSGVAHQEPSGPYRAPQPTR